MHPVERRSGAPQTDHTNRTSSEASTSPDPWLGGRAEANPVASARDVSDALLLPPFFISTQLAPAGRNSVGNDIVGKQGLGATGGLRQAMVMSTAATSPLGGGGCLSALRDGAGDQEHDDGEHVVVLPPAVNAFGPTAGTPTPATAGAAAEGARGRATRCGAAPSPPAPLGCSP